MRRRLGEIAMSDEEFEALVVEAVESLPPEILKQMENVAVTIADWPTRGEMLRAGVDPRRGSLFGLYEGVPKTRRTSHYGLVPPDKITIYQGPLLTYVKEPEKIREQIRRTVLHEIAHHFGFNEEEIRRLGY